MAVPVTWATDLLARDKRCVACGALPGSPLPCAAHHRILGNRADNRASNGLILCGTGNTPPGCHGLTHQHSRIARDAFGYIVSRHATRAVTAASPVWYNQPAIGPYRARIGWFMIRDDGAEPEPITGIPDPGWSLLERINTL